MSHIGRFLLDMLKERMLEHARTVQRWEEKKKVEGQNNVRQSMLPPTTNK